MTLAVETKPKSGYEDDRYAWLLEQIDRLAAQRFRELDLAELIEELEDLADTRRNAILNNARVVVEHLLKLQHSPAVDPRNKWRASVREHRRRLALALTDRLREALLAELDRIYTMAREDAAAGMRDYGEHAAADALPATCPYTLEQITGDWWP